MLLNIIVTMMMRFPMSLSLPQKIKNTLKWGGGEERGGKKKTPESNKRIQEHLFPQVLDKRPQSRIEIHHGT